MPTLPAGSRHGTGCYGGAYVREFRHAYLHMTYTRVYAGDSVSWHETKRRGSAARERARARVPGRGIIDTDGRALSPTALLPAVCLRP